MLSVGEIKKFIENDASSKAKQFAETGVRYYEGDHDIKDYRIFFIDAEGKIQENKCDILLHRKPRTNRPFPSPLN